MTDQIRYLPSCQDFESIVFRFDKVFREYACYHGKIVKVSIPLPHPLPFHPEFTWLTHFLESKYRELEFSWCLPDTLEINRAHRHVINYYTGTFRDLERLCANDHQRICAARDEGSANSLLALNELLSSTSCKEVVTT